jgi:predicted DNA binding CopG/RHH family protein
MKRKKDIPKFDNEDQEREFWSSNDSTEYIDWRSGERLILPNLKPSVKTISLRLPETLLNELKFLANKKDVPYQSLLKMFLSERVQRELNNLSKQTAEN